jgi:hypothetical protein
MSFTPVYAELLLKHLVNNDDIADTGDAAGLQNSAAAGSYYLRLTTTVPQPGDTAASNEISYTGGYTGQAIARTTGGFTVSQVAGIGAQWVNAADILFAQRTDAGAAVVAFGWTLSSAATGATRIDFCGACGDVASKQAFTAIAAGDVITIPGHSLAVDNRVVFSSEPGATLAAGITAGTVYWVKTVSSNDITVSATQGGAALDITAAGSGYIQRVQGLTINELTIPRFLAGTLKYILG